VFLRLSAVGHCSFKEEILSTYEFAHGLSVLKTTTTLKAGFSPQGDFKDCTI